MSAWKHSATKAARKHLRSGESVTDSNFVLPAVATPHITASQVEGFAGVTATEAGPVDIDDSFGLAATLPHLPLHLIVTEQRVLLFGHGKLLRKPAKLLGEIDRGVIAGVVLSEGGRATHPLTIFFNDGSAKTFDSPRLRNNAQAFRAELSRSARNSS